MSSHFTGTLLTVTVEEGGQAMLAVYLGAVEGAVDRPDRRIYAVDNVDGWILLMESQIVTAAPILPPLQMIVVKGEIGQADLEVIVGAIREAAISQEPGGFLILPEFVEAQIEFVEVQDKADAPDAVGALRKILTDQEGDLTPAEVALCAQLRGP